MPKRIFDIVVSTAALILLSPLLFIVAILIKLTSPGPIFYRATRVGKDSTQFTLIKFRSMVINADRLGPGITGASDGRITSIGRLLRRAKIDELPQLINVLKGDMSIVGPRPEDPRYVALYTDEQRHVLNVRPGITSPASVTYRHEEQLLVGEDWEQIYITEVMPAKLQLDLAYARHSGLWQDLKIILRTLTALFR